MMQLPTAAAVNTLPLIVQLPLLLPNDTAPVPLPPLLPKLVVLPTVSVVATAVAVSVGWFAISMTMDCVTCGASR